MILNAKRRCIEAASGNLQEAKMLLGWLQSLSKTKNSQQLHLAMDCYRKFCSTCPEVSRLQRAQDAFEWLIEDDKGNPANNQKHLT